MARRSLGEVDFSSILGSGQSYADRQAATAKRRRKIDVEAAVQRAVSTQSDVLGEVDALALSGDTGGKAAKSALERVLNAPGYSDKAKKRAQEFYESGHGDLDNSLFDTVKDVAGNAVGNIFKAIDVPKRAVVGAVDELFSAVDSDYDNDASWIENVFSKESYGFGDVVQGAADSDPDSAAGKLLDTKWGGRIAGLIGDIGLDPLTYAGVGIVKDVAKPIVGGERILQGAETASKIKTAETVNRPVRKALSKVAGTDARKSLNVTHDEALRQAARLRRYDIVEKLSKSKGVGKLNSADLEALGYRGGLRWGQSGRVLVPWEITRHAGAPFRGAGKVYEKLGLGPLGRQLFGGEELKALRKMIYDPALSGERKANAILAQDAVNHVRLGEEVVTNAFGPELHELAQATKKAGIDHELLGTALVGADDAARAAIDAKAPGLIDKFEQYISRKGTKINQRVGEKVVPETFAEGLPVILSDEARRFLKGRHYGGKWVQVGQDLRKMSGPGWNQAGDLGKVGTQEMIDLFGDNNADQVRGIFQSLGFNGDPFESDILRVMARELRSSAHILGEHRGLQSLRASGVLQATSDHVADIAGARGTLEEHIQGLMSAHEAANKATDAAASVIDQGIKDFRKNLKTLRDAERTAEMAYDAAREAGASSRKLASLRKAMNEAGQAKRDAVKKLRFLQDQAGHGAANLERRLGTVQAPARTSLAPTVADRAVPESKRVFAEAQPRMAQTDEAARILEDPEAAAAELAERSDQAASALDETPLRNTTKRQLLITAEESRSHAQEFLRVLNETPDLPETTRTALALQASAHEAEAQLAESGLQVVTDDEMIRWLETSTAQRTVSEMAKRDMSRYGKDFEEADSGVVAAFVNSESFFKSPDEWNALVRAYRSTVRGFKVYAMLTPGFPVRNSLGAFFNNYVAQIDTSSYLIFGHEFKKFYGGWLKAAAGKESQALEAVSAEWRPIFEEMMVNGQFADANRILGEVNRNVEKDVGEGGARRLLTDHRITRGARRINERVEQYHRGALMFDSLRKGATFDQALERVYKFHFNYSDLSKVEEGIREVIPFWTWTSRNLPLQLEQSIRNPRMYARFNQIRDNLSDDEKGTLIPDYVRESPVAIHLNQEVFGHQVDYLMPDLPFANVDEQLQQLQNPLALGAQNAAPIVRVPIEVFTEKRFFGNIPLGNKLKPAPRIESTLAKIPGVTEFLVGAHLAKRHKDGTLLMTDKVAYAIESFLPSFGKTRRLFPADEKNNAKVFGAFVSFLGVGNHTITPGDRTSEAYRRADSLEALIEQLKGQGIIPTDPP